MSGDSEGPSDGGGDGPGIRIWIRDKQGFSLLPPFPKTEAEPPLRNVACSSVKFSSDGSLLAVITPTSVSIFRAASPSQPFTTFEAASVQGFAFSPLGTYVQTFCRPNGQNKNLAIRRLADGAVVWEQFQKSFSKSAWPTVQFSADESVAARVVSGEVQFLNGHQLEKGVQRRLKLPGISSAILSSSPGSHIAAFVGEHKGAPASVRIFSTSQVTPEKSDPAPVARRSFFKASSVRLLWNEGSSAVLVLAQSDVDKTNQSYYGESNLHFLTCDASFEGAVPLSKEGPVHDVQWAPSGKEFVAVYGFMPAKATLFDSKCRPIFEFGSGPRNTIRWNPTGRFLCLAGFGNLPGDVEFWDRSSLRSLGSCKAACGVSCDWSPDGRSFLVATTTPRLQVDNCIRVFKYDGSLLLHQPYEALYEADWLPAPPLLFPDRPPSPRKQQSENGKAPPSASVPAAKPAAYRPPHASSQRIGGQNKYIPPGVTPVEESKSAAKNRKRKEKVKKDSAAEVEAKDKGKEDKQQQVEESSSQPSHSMEGESQEASSGNEDVKKGRAINKKLRQIEDLRKKKSEGVVLQPEQEEKLAQEASLRAELALLKL